MKWYNVHKIWDHLLLLRLDITRGESDYMLSSHILLDPTESSGVM